MINWDAVVTAEDKAAQEAQVVREVANAEARAYLSATDWYVVRSQETGQPIPEEISQARRAARESVV